MSNSPRLALPFLVPGQAQKEVYHNEALQRLDVLVAPAVEEGPRPSPPGKPAPGACYIVGTKPVRGWAGKSDCVAAWTSGGWRFVEPIEGMSLFVRSEDRWALYRSGAWEIGTLRGSAVIVDGQQVIGARLPAIGSPAGGDVVDVEARKALGDVLAALRRHGLVEI